MTHMNKLRFKVIYLALLIFTISTPHQSSANFFKLGDGWIDYGNGAINLDNVGVVRPYVTYQLTLASDDEYTQDDVTFISYNPSFADLRDNRMENFLLYFNTLDSEMFYIVDLSIGIYFDDFNLLYDEFQFFNVPDPSTEEGGQLIIQIEAEGMMEKFSEFLILAKTHYFEEVSYDDDLSDEEFLKILSNVKIPDETDAKKISVAFDSLEKSYLEIVN